MSAPRARRAREGAQRHRLIRGAARELVEAEGWDALTTRRLAERVECSQPVLHSHFKGTQGGATRLDLLVEGVRPRG